MVKEVSQVSWKSNWSFKVLTNGIDIVYYGI